MAIDYETKRRVLDGVDLCSTVGQHIMCVNGSPLKKYNYYLVYLSKSTWDKRSGYRFVMDEKDLWYRGYDCSIFAVDVSGGGKVLKLREYSHDVLSGYTSYIIGLTDEQYLYLRDKVFDRVKGFVKSSVSRSNLCWEE